MSLQHVVGALLKDPWQSSLHGASSKLRPGRMLQIDGLSPFARSVTTAILAASDRHPTLVVTARLDGAEEIAGALAEYLGDGHEPLVWPVHEALPYEQLPVDRLASARRVEVLTRLLDNEPVIVVAPARALAEIVRPPGDVRERRIELSIGQRLRVDRFIQQLVEQGYAQTSLVSEPGQLSRRGGIIDVFPPTDALALRIDLFGDEIESLRLFDPESQRSVRSVREFQILPPFEIGLDRRTEAVEWLRALDTSALRPEVADEWSRNLVRLENGDVRVGLDLLAPVLTERPASILDYLPANHLVVVPDPASVHLAASQLEAQAEELRAALEDAGELPAGMARPYFVWEEIASRLARTRQVTFAPPPEAWSPSVAVSFDGTEAFSQEFVTFAGRLDLLLDEVGSWLADGWAVLIATEQAQRMAEVLEERDIFPRRRTQSRTPSTVALDRVEPPTPGTVEVVHSRLQGGWRSERLRIVLLTDREIFGYRHAGRPPSRRRRVDTGRVLERLDEGQYVVHVEHGIARYGGIVRLQVTGAEREYLLLEYADTDRLYLPVDQIDRITPYEGGGIEPKLTRLGSQEWARVKQRVRQAVREMAFELLQLYAARESSQAEAFPPDSVWDRELEESFPYVETPDQLRAITDVKQDLQQTRPMDRLVCGDVGYGKTEVALRAAFKAVNAGYQIAILVPTTVLALQHYRTFQTRLAAFPVRVEMLSRLRGRRQQASIVAGIASGEVDIVIGTHRLLQRDVSFRKLGLLVIDEEQRFGVTHKEQLKRARTDVHVLTMTATPIPRTLHMALAGIRDLSVINTPPRDRTPIRTFVAPSNDVLIREAILRELSRGGQVYFVHNRVQSIYHLLHRLQRLVPEARFGVGHGQMDEGELEQVMLTFVEHEFDVLVCTTIIESGVDIPNVNTVIIDQAHSLGLTQLYQLRGRVGRSHHRAYAYLLYDATRPLSDEAVARLSAVQEATELGAGFQIALRDLEIRGAGNILGAEQSGHIAAVGFDLYTRMLAMAVEEVRAGRPIEEPEAVSIDLPIDAVIPESYSGSEEVRIDLYRRLAAARSYAQLRDLQEELIDRFGAIPEPVQRLFDLARLRVRANQLGITAILERDGEVYIRPLLGSRLNQQALRRAVGEGVTVTPNQVRLSIQRLKCDVWEAVIAVVDAVEEANATVFAAAG